MIGYIVIGAIAVGVIAFLSFVVALLFRRVVETNQVHIVQSQKKTTSYGTARDGGNVYYAWPSWLPVLGVKVIVMPVSNFSLDLKDYDAYDEKKVPFVVDISAFFRVEDTNVAAQRVSNFEELKLELRKVLEGTVRTILGNNKIEEIMIDRQQFGQAFTAEAEEDLKAWGVIAVKSMELMDVRDPSDGSSKVIRDIQAREMSTIDRESREIRAENERAARIKEIEAKREQDLAEEQASQAVGERQAQKDKAVGIAREQATQEIKAQAAITAAKNVEVQRVEDTGRAEIAKGVALVKAAEEAETVVIRADGRLEESRRDAEGVKAEGEAAAFAAKEMERAPVLAKIELAEAISEMPAYLAYLEAIRRIEMGEAVGQEQAKALAASDAKLIVNAGDVSSGADTLMSLFSPQGGTGVAGMLEAIAQSGEGQALLSRFGLGKPSKAPAASAPAPKVVEPAKEIDDTNV